MTKLEPQPKRKSQPGTSASGRGNVAGLVVVVVIAVALFWIITAMVKHNALQNCLDSGRRDCVATPGTG